MIVSLLALQSRASENAEVASQLAAASDRLPRSGASIGVSSLDGVQTFEFKQYIEDLCSDFSTMLSLDRAPSGSSASKGFKSSCRLSPLFARLHRQRLITNATKYGKGRITIRLEGNPAKGYALSVSNDDLALADT